MCGYYIITRQLNKQAGLWCCWNSACIRPRVECVIKVDYRSGHRGRLKAKVASIEKRIGRKLKTI